MRAAMSEWGMQDDYEPMIGAIEMSFGGVAMDIDNCSVIVDMMVSCRCSWGYFRLFQNSSAQQAA